MLSIAIDGSVKPASSLPFSQSLVPACTKRLESPSGLCMMSSRTFLVSFVILIRKSSVARDVLGWRRYAVVNCFHTRFFALLVVILIGVMDLSDVAFFRRRSYFMVLKIFDFDLMRLASASFTS